MKESRVKKNTLYSIIKSCSSILFPLITFPYISRILLTENVGKINFGLSIVSYFSLIASLGISTYAIRECSKLKNDTDKFNKVANEIYSINIVTTIISYFLLALFLLFYNKLSNYRLLISIQSISILFCTLGTDWLNNVREDFKYITIRTVIFQFFSLLLMYIFVKQPSDYIKYALITVISSSGANILNMFYIRKYYKLKFILKLNLKLHLKPILMMFAMILAQQIFVNSDITIIGLIKGDNDVGLYSTSVKIYNIVCTLMNSIAWVVIPKLSYLFKENNYEEINRTIKYVIGFSVTLGFPIAIGLLFLSPNIIILIAGKEFLKSSLSLSILSISFVFSIIWGIVMNMLLLPDGKEKICLRSCVFCAIINIVLNLIFIPKFGFIVAAITTTISQFLGLVLCAPHVNKKINLEISKSFLISIIMGCISIILFIFLISNMINGMINVLFISIIGSFFIYIIEQVLFKNYWVEDILNDLKNRRKDN